MTRRDPCRRAQLLLGLQSEFRWGRPAFLTIYLASGVGGNILSAVLSPHVVRVPRRAGEAPRAGSVPWAGGARAPAGSATPRAVAGAAARRGCAAGRQLVSPSGRAGFEWRPTRMV